MNNNLTDLLDELQVEIHIADSQVQLTCKNGLTKRRLLNILVTIEKAYDVTEELLEKLSFMEVLDGLDRDTAH
jgi:hypothetical protein